MDWTEACRMLGVSESATEAEIREQYIYKAQLLHPDKNQDKPEHIRKKAEAELVLVNQAYTFISNPNNNPYRVPPKLAVEPMGVRFKDVSVGERKTTSLTIRNTGGPYTSVWIDNRPAPWLAVTGVKSIGTDRLPLEVILECRGAGQPGNKYACDLLIKLENEKTKVVDFATVKIELDLKLEPANTEIKKELFTSVPIHAPAPTPKPVPEVPRPEPEPQPVLKGRMGFSIGAFLINFLAFAIVGAVAGYSVFSLLAVSDMAFMIGAIIYTGLTFGVSLNHGITVGSRPRQEKSKKAQL
jgi:hypothetical protein